MLTDTILRIHDRLAPRDGAVLLTGLAAAAIGLVAASRTQLDMSFRPLFAHDEVHAAATAEFEERFGQASGAGVAVLVERGRPLDAELLLELAELTDRLASIAGVTEVISPARIPALEWGRDGARGRLLIGRDQLSSPEAAESAAATLLAAGAGVLADSGRVSVVLARLAPPLDALAERRAIIREIRSAAEAWRPDGVRLHYTGVSVVEEAYESAVPLGMAVSLLLTSAAVALLLFGLFGHPAAVLAALAGVAVTAPLTIGLLPLTGRSLTMLGSMAPTIVLIIGAADAVHMIRRWQSEVRTREQGAVRRMMQAMALPCALTTITTALGFAALSVARINAIREFGILVAAGVILVFAANMVLVPAVLRRWGARIPAPMPGTSRTLAGLGVMLQRAPAATLAIALLVTAVAIAGVPRIRVDQRFNEELRTSHPVRAAQNLLETKFGGFLGPDVEIARASGGILAPDALTRLRALREDIASMPGVDGVSGIADLVPAGRQADARAAMDALRDDPIAGSTVRERLHTSERTTLRVQTGDLGTAAALTLAEDIASAAARRLGDGYEARIVGQWWLAQLGTSSLLRDMIASFLTSALLVLPVLALALRSWRLLLIALPANLLPMLAALGYMGWSGTSLRIGTALVMAVALAIAVDDTIHMLARAEESRRRGAAPRRAVQRALTDTGSALVTSTLVLLAGFLSMLANPLAAIRDMGAVAAVALSAALVADLFLLPPLYALAHGGLRNPRVVATSSVRSSRPAPRRTFRSNAARVTAARI